MKLSWKKPSSRKELMRIKLAREGYLPMLRAANDIRRAKHLPTLSLAAMGSLLSDLRRSGGWNFHRYSNRTSEATKAVWQAATGSRDMSGQEKVVADFVRRKNLRSGVY